jgi:S1-C subfamily serine protease
MDIEEQPQVESVIPERKPRRGRVVAGVTALALGLVAGGTGLAWSATIAHSSVSAAAPSTSSPRVLPNQRSYQNFANRASDTTTANAATAAQKVGVVTIVSTLDYDTSEKAAGTGTILSSNGLILTNNHVIEGSTSVEVTVESTGKSYSATVIGTDKTDDVAVLKLSGASGLTAAKYATTGSAAVGDAVTAIGNAEGTGDLVSAVGTVTATAQSITVQGDTTDASENLSNLIETNADIVPGDSGGPLLDSSGRVIGMDTAASAGTQQTVGYAIPIAEALTIARQIESGVAGGNVAIGNPAFLGVELSGSASTDTTSTDSTNSDSAAIVAGVIADTPAATAGIAAGDTITALNGAAVTSAAALSPMITAHAAGDQVSVSWTDVAGAAHTATVTLQAGPAI